MFPLLCCSKWPNNEATEEAEGIQETISRDSPDNVLMMQAFEWYVPNDGGHWRRLREALPSLKAIGVDKLWIPAGCKAMSPSSNGYDIYDLYDLGEFHQKEGEATKWGTKGELQRLASRAQELGIGVHWDAVLNHRAGADFSERFQAIMVDAEDRNINLSQPEEITGWVGFDFRGRKGKYSSMQYHWQHFNGIDWDDSRKKDAIYKVAAPGKDWAKDVSTENGNYDYLMFANLDYSNAEVQEDVLNWGRWIATELPLCGMRLDAAKHYSRAFQSRFIHHMRNEFGQSFEFVAEYWQRESEVLLEYLEKMDHQVNVFDSTLVERFSVISRLQKGDLRRVSRIRW